jgi:glycosyltransferase involved in cell wall biosynthesis
LIPRKGFQFLIQALPDVCKQVNADFRIQIAGDGPYRSELVKLAESLNVSDKIDFLGSIDYANLPQKYHEADIFSLCSLAEGMPLVVLEAMGTGLPIVASRVQGITDLVEVGTNGELFDPGDVNQLVKHLVRLIDDGEQRVKMGQKSTELAQGYDWENIAQSYLELYEKVVRIEK